MFDEMFSDSRLRLDNLTFVMVCGFIIFSQSIYFCYMLFHRILKNVGSVGINTLVYNFFLGWHLAGVIS